jgi:hypothetical protein
MKIVTEPIITVSGANSSTNSTAVVSIANSGANSSTNSNEEPEEDEDDDNGDRHVEIEEEIDPEEQERLEQEEKEELIVKFRILKKANPKNSDIPDYNEHDDLATMKKMYSRTVNEIAFDRKISNYRNYLSFSFMVIEFGLNYLGINMKDFAKTQMASIDDYNSLLVELGEKTEGSWMDNVPVEVRLLGMVMFQAVTFWFVKNKGIDIGNVFKLMTNGMNNSSGTNSTSSSGNESSGPEEEKPVKKMKGPSIRSKA